MIIAHDLGTTGNKASLHHDDGRLIAAVTVPYPAHFAAGGVAEQDPADWWHAVVTATRDLLSRTGTAAARLQPRRSGNPSVGCRGARQDGSCTRRTPRSSVATDRWKAVPA